MTIQITSKSIPKPFHITLTAVATNHTKKQEYGVYFVSRVLFVGPEGTESIHFYIYQITFFENAEFYKYVMYHLSNSLLFMQLQFLHC
jgi:hypothetical protein